LTQQQTSPQSKETVLPSIFANSCRKVKKSSGNINKDIENESKWGRIDKLFIKIDNYPTDSLSRVLVALAKQ